jgi:hypothetical protein
LKQLWAQGVQVAGAPSRRTAGCFWSSHNGDVIAVGETGIVVCHIGCSVIDFEQGDRHTARDLTLQCVLTVARQAGGDSGLAHSPLAGIVATGRVVVAGSPLRFAGGKMVGTTGTRPEPAPPGPRRCFVVVGGNTNLQGVVVGRCRQPPIAGRGEVLVGA